MKSISVAMLRAAIQELPSDKPTPHPSVWYATQKEHWLGWLRYYGGPGAYGRKGGAGRDAEFAYNHIVNFQMLLWLIKAAGLPPATVRKAHAHRRRERRSCNSLQRCEGLFPGPKWPTCSSNGATRNR